MIGLIHLSKCPSHCESFVWLQRGLTLVWSCTEKNMTFFMKGLFSKYDEIPRK